MKGMYDEATVGVPNDFPDAASYTIYYKLAEEKDFNNSVTNIAPGTKSYTIAYLKRDGKYQYRYAAVDAEGKEFVFSEILPLSGLRPM